MSVNLCHKCNKEVDVNNGGCAIMLAFCRNHTTNLINLSYCHDCYNTFVDHDLRNLNAVANLGLIFGDKDGET